MTPRCFTPKNSVTRERKVIIDKKIKGVQEKSVEGKPGLIMRKASVTVKLIASSV